MARYDGLRKLERNKMLREYALEHPDLSLKEIGQRFNISATRVWHILHGKGESCPGSLPVPETASPGQALKERANEQH